MLNAISIDVGFTHPDGENGGLIVDAVRNLRADLAIALRSAAEHQLHEGIDNHFSVALPDGRFLMNGYGPHWSELTPEDILEIADDGTVLSGRGRWELAAFTIHRAVHRARPDAVAVFHTHMPWATAVSNLVDGLDTRLTQSAMYFHGRVATLDYDGIATAEAEGERLRSLMAGGRACAVMMRNHGVTVIGASIADAWHKLYMLDRACQAQALSLSMGQPLIRVDDHTAEKTAAQWQEVEQDAAALLFDAIRRAVVRRDAVAGAWREIVVAADSGHAA